MSSHLVVVTPGDTRQKSQCRVWGSVSFVSSIASRGLGQGAEGLQDKGESSAS